MCPHPKPGFALRLPSDRKQKHNLFVVPTPSCPIPQRPSAQRPLLSLHPTPESSGPWLSLSSTRCGHLPAPCSFPLPFPRLLLSAGRKGPGAPTVSRATHSGGGRGGSKHLAPLSSQAACDPSPSFTPSSRSRLKGMVKGPPQMPSSEDGCASEQPLTESPRATVPAGQGLACSAPGQDARPQETRRHSRAD